MTDISKRSWTEIVELHRFLEEWFRGDMPADTTAAARIESTFALQCELIARIGVIDRSASLQERLTQAHGSWPDMKIWVDKFVPIWVADNLALVRYEEWRRFGGQTTGRVTSALFQNAPNGPNGVQWLYIHETWLAGHGPQDAPSSTEPPTET